jgi:molybdate transport system permease protein
MSDWLPPEAATALALSLKVSLVAVLVSLPLGVLVAYALARWRFAGHGLLNGLVHLPLILPPVVTGYLLLLTFGRQGWIGSILWDWFGFTFAFRWTGAALAAGVMAFPLLVRANPAGDRGGGPQAGRGRRNAGRLAARGLCHGDAALILPGVIAGAVLAFAKAMGEFGATITFVANIPGETQTLPTAIYSFLQVPGGDGAAMRLVLISVAVAMVALALSEWLSRRVAARIAGR